MRNLLFCSLLTLAACEGLPPTGAMPVPDSTPPASPSPFTSSGKSALNNPALVNHGRVTVFKSGSTFYAVDEEGTILSSSTTPDVVIAAALDYSGDIDIHYVPGGYVLSSNFAGFDIKSNQQVHLDKAAQLVVPNDYTGFVFRFGANVTGSILEGGTILETQPAQRRWTGVLFHATQNSGVYFNTARDLAVVNANVGVKLLCDGLNSWINGNLVDTITLSAPNVGVLFESLPSFQTGFGSNRNVFNNILGQSSSNTQVGFKDIAGLSNQFFNARMWDLSGSQVSANITANANNTIIIGGIMTVRNFSDLGANTKIIDDWQNAKFPKATVGTLSTSSINTGGQFELGVKQTADTGFDFALTPYADANTVNWSLWNASRNERFYCQRNPNAFVCSSVRQSGGAAVRPIIYQVQDVAQGTTTEAFRINPDGSMRFSSPDRFDSYQDLKAIPQPTTPPAGYGRMYVRAIDANNDGLFIQLKQNGVVTEFRIAPP
jgi:hypothetical protein